MSSKELFPNISSRDVTEAVFHVAKFDQSVIAVQPSNILSKLVVSVNIGELPDPTFVSAVHPLSVPANDSQLNDPHCTMFVSCVLVAASRELYKLKYGNALPEIVMLYTPGSAYV